MKLLWKMVALGLVIGAVGAVGAVSQKRVAEGEQAAEATPSDLSQGQQSQTESTDQPDIIGADLREALGSVPDDLPPAPLDERLRAAHADVESVRVVPQATGAPDLVMVHIFAPENLFVSRVAVMTGNIARILPIIADSGKQALIFTEVETAGGERATAWKAHYPASALAAADWNTILPEDMWALADQVTIFPIARTKTREYCRDKATAYDLGRLCH